MFNLFNKSKRFLKIDFITSGQKFTIEVRNDGNRPHTVNRSLFRTENSHYLISPQIGPVHNFTTEENFEEEVRGIIHHIRNRELIYPTYEDALICFCSDELRKYGKLYWVDIQGYLDACLHIILAIQKSRNRNTMSQKEGFEIRLSLGRHIYKKLGQYIIEQ